MSLISKHGNTLLHTVLSYLSPLQFYRFYHEVPVQLFKGPRASLLMMRGKRGFPHITKDNLLGITSKDSVNVNELNIDAAFHF